MKSYTAILTATMLSLSLIAAQAAVTVTLFDNQFNTTWDIDNDGNGSFESTVATYTPGSTASRFRETGQTQVWDVETMTPQPWSLDGVIFGGGGNNSGAITTEFLSAGDFTHTVSWGMDQVGGAAPFVYTATVYAGSGTGGSTLGTQTIGLNEDKTFSFTGNGGAVTLEISLNTPSFGHASADSQLDYVGVTYNDTLPEPSTLAMLGIGAAIALRARRRQTMAH